MRMSCSSSGFMCIVMLACATVQAAELFTRVDTAVPSEGRLWSDVIAANTSLLTEGGPKDISLHLFDQDCTVVRERIGRRGPSDWSWFGRVNGGTDPAIFVVRGDRLFGYLLSEGREFSITSLEDGYSMISEIDPLAFSCGTEPPESHLRAMPEQGADRAAATITINVLFLYTQWAEDSAGGAANMLARIQTGMDIANQALLDSGSEVRFATVRVEKTAYDDHSKSMYDVLNAMSNYNDGAFDDLLEKQAAWAADQAVVVTALAGAAANGACHIPAQSEAPWAGCTMTVDDVQTNTLAHELGHNMGLRHDWSADSQTTPYSYAHGYGCQEGNFRDIMAWLTACPSGCVRVNYYSNPLKTYNGYPMGIPEGQPNPADCVRALSGTGPVAATFRSYLSTCTYSVSPTDLSVVAGGGQPSFTVSVPMGCYWTLHSNASWITFLPPPGEGGHRGWPGDTGVVLVVAANTTGNPRTGTVTAAGHTVTVHQEAGSSECNVSFNPSVGSFPPGGGPGTANVVASGCAWNATSGAGWIHITSGGSGSGNGTVQFTVDANTQPNSRQGVIYAGTNAAQFTVLQDGTASLCPITVNPTSAMYQSTGGSGSFNVTGNAGCSYTATPQATWLHVTGGGSGTASGTVSYSVDPYTTGTFGRTGYIAVATTVGSQAFHAVSQLAPGQVCNYTVGSFATSYPDEGGSAPVSVTTTPGCPWTAGAAAEWVTFAPNTGSGSGSTTMIVAANFGAARSTTVTVAGHSYTVNQDAYSPGPSGPSIASVTSKKGKPGKPAIINGTGFSATKTSNTVKFGKYAATVTKATTTKLTVTIPTKCKSGKTYNVYVQVSGKKSNTVQFKLK